jgi:hypothetical protein
MNTGSKFDTQLEKCYRPKIYYTGSILPSEGIDFYDSENNTFKKNNRTLLRLFIRRSVDKTIIHKEKLVYDFQALLSGVGGSLSLFIGISAFSICNQIIDAMIYGFRMMRKNLECFRTSKKIFSAKLTKSPRPSKIPRPLANMTMTAR